MRRLGAGIIAGYDWAADFLADDARRLGTAGLRASPGWRKVMERPSGHLAENNLSPPPTCWPHSPSECGQDDQPRRD
jgi:hypothetical protein